MDSVNNPPSVNVSKSAKAPAAAPGPEASRPSGGERLPRGMRPADGFVAANLISQLHTPLPGPGFRGGLMPMQPTGWAAVAAQLSGTTWSWIKKVYPECEDNDDELESCLYSALGELAPPSFEHSNRVGQMAEKFAQHLGLGKGERKTLGRAIRFKECGMVGLQVGQWSEEEREQAAEAIGLGGAFHDIGKMAISRDILEKPGPLTPEERKEIELHPLIGEALLQNIPTAHGLLPAVRNHHEKWDGTGYPDGLSGDAIPWVARIIAIVDSFDAMTEGRPYRRALTQEEACAEIVRGKGTQFDPELADNFAHMVMEMHEEA